MARSYRVRNEKAKWEIMLTEVEDTLTSLNWPLRDIVGAVFWALKSAIYDDSEYARQSRDLFNGLRDLMPVQFLTFCEFATARNMDDLKRARDYALDGWAISENCGQAITIGSIYGLKLCEEKQSKEAILANWTDLTS